MSQLEKEMRKLSDLDLGLGANLDKTKTSPQNDKSIVPEKLVDSLTRELALLRKELGKSPKYNSQTHSNINNSSSIPNFTPTGGSGGFGGGTTNQAFGLGMPNSSDALKKLATLGVVLKGLGMVNRMAKESQSAQSQAYKVFGSTLAYTNYAQARRDASRLGEPYGYAYDEVMDVTKSNMSRAGFKDLQSQQGDISELLKTSKALGVDPNSLANASGGAVATGVIKHGEQKQFANLLAESVVSAGMTGREEEQLKVLEDIANSLASVNATVSKEGMLGSLNMYNALVSGNENLKGQRGSDYVKSISDLATSGDSTLDVLAGFGTKYSGIHGKLELARLASSDPQRYMQQVYQGAQKYGVGQDQLTYMLYKKFGSISKADATYDMLGRVQTGNYMRTQDFEDTGHGQSLVERQTRNYRESSISELERYEANKRGAKATAGDTVNAGKAPMVRVFNSLSEGGKVGSMTAVGLGSGVGVSRGYSMLMSGIGKSTGLGSILPSATQSTSKLAMGLKGASTVTKSLPMVGVGLEALSTMVSMNDALQRGDERSSASHLGGGVGAVGGGTGGAMMGALAGTAIFPGVGTVIGAILGGTGGGLLGKYTGNAVGETIYDAVNDKQTYSDDQRKQIKSYANQVEKLYNTEGISSARNYTNSVVTPYLKSIGVSDSITDKYKWDFGTPDFLKDVKGGVFGDMKAIKPNEIMEENTNSITQLTRSINDLDDTLTESRKPSTGDTRVSNKIGTTPILEKEKYVPYSVPSSGSSSSGTSGTEVAQSSTGNSKKHSSWWSRILGMFHATGNDYVPYDDYMANLHKGEMVLDKHEADLYRQGRIGRGGAFNGSLSLNVNVGGAIDGMTPENQNKITNHIVNNINESELTNLLATSFQRLPNF